MKIKGIEVEAEEISYTEKNYKNDDPEFTQEFSQDAYDSPRSHEANVPKAPRYIIEHKDIVELNDYLRAVETARKAGVLNEQSALNGVLTRLNSYIKIE